MVVILSENIGMLLSKNVIYQEKGWSAVAKAIVSL